MHALPSEIGESKETATLFAAGNAATYVLQVEDDRPTGVVAGAHDLEATRDVLQMHRGVGGVGVSRRYD
jgi:hypothetical protein